MPHCQSNMNVFLQSHCWKAKKLNSWNWVWGRGSYTFSTGSHSKSHSKLIWSLNMPCMTVVAFPKLLHTSKNSCTKSWITPTTVPTVVENSSIHVVSRVKLESLTCYIYWPLLTHSSIGFTSGCAIQHLYLHHQA